MSFPSNTLSMQNNSSLYTNFNNDLERALLETLVNVKDYDDSCKDKINSLVGQMIDAQKKRYTKPQPLQAVSKININRMSYSEKDTETLKREIKQMQAYIALYRYLNNR